MARLGRGFPARPKYLRVIPVTIPDTTLVVADLTQAVAMDAVTLTQAHTLAVADTTQAVAADSVTLTQAHTLVVEDASNAVAMDAVVLSTSATLVVADTTQAVALDAVTLTQAHTLVVADTSQAVAMDAVVLSVPSGAGTTAQRFYPHSVDWDGTDPSSGDVRTCETALPALTTGSSVNFDISGAKTFTVDPYTARGTGAATGVDSKFGWAIDIAGADGMASTATAKRWIKAGVWTFAGTIVASPVASLNAATVGVNVYRVAASPSTTRTLIFSGSVSPGVIAATGTSWQIDTASQAEIVLEANETIQVTYTLACTGQVGGLVLDFVTGNSGPTTDTLIDVPAPGIRTLSEGTGTATGLGTATGTASKVLASVGTATGLGTATGVLGATAAMQGTATGVGTATGALGASAEMVGTATGSGTATGVFTGIGGMVGTATGTGDAVGVLGAIGGMVGSAAGTGTATGVLGATGGMVGTATGLGTAAGLASSVAGTVGTATGEGTATGVGGAVVGTVGTVEIGSGSPPPSTTTTVIFGLFD